jgi:hypothetical protein
MCVIKKWSRSDWLVQSNGAPCDGDDFVDSPWILTVLVLGRYVTPHADVRLLLALKL